VYQLSKVNLQAPEVQIREVRLGSITGYLGTAGNLVKCSHSGKLSNQSRSFSQCMGCSAVQAVCLLSMIRDAVIVNHAPVGCSGDASFFNFTYRVGQMERGLPATNGRFFTSNLKENDTIFGAAQKLRDTVRLANERTHPNAIFITSSCAAGIIGDDIEEVAEEMTKELGIPVIGCYCEGFKSKVWTTGFDAAYHSIIRKFVKPPRKKTNQVNIINFWGSHIFDGLLRKLGYEPQYIVPFSTVEQLSHISEAAATIQICPTLGSYIGAALEQVYGVPEIKSPPAFGVAGTDQWLRELGRVLGRKDEVERFIRKGHERIAPKLEEYRRKFKGKTAYVAAGAAHGHAIIAILNELGFDVKGVSLFHHDPIFDNGNVGSDALAHDVHTYGDIRQCHICNKQIFEVVNILNRIRPDLLIARHCEMQIWGAKLGIPSLVIEDEQFGFGYDGLLNYASRIEETLGDREFIENLAGHSKLPYTKWWLEQNPNTFLEVV
jgi:nitrogenase molybdenum-iron protein alpha chain